MVELSHWQKVAVPQRYETGCIPTSYEWMIRFQGIEGIGLDTFQEDFDLKRRNEGDNSFVPIANKIMKKYPQVNIRINDFPLGSQKIAFLRQLLGRNVPCILSIALSPQGGWHIVPIVSIDDKGMVVIWAADANGNRVREFSTHEIVFRHDNWTGGKDISWIEH
jgi:hypothetical protein